MIYLWSKYNPMPKIILKYFLDIEASELPPIGDMLICYDVPETELHTKSHFHDCDVWVGKQFCLLRITSDFPDIIMGLSTRGDIENYLNENAA